MANDITANEINSKISAVNAKKKNYDSSSNITHFTSSLTDTDTKDILESASASLRYTTNPYNKGKSEDPNAVTPGSVIYANFFNYLNQVSEDMTNKIGCDGSCTGFCSAVCAGTCGSGCKGTCGSSTCSNGCAGSCTTGCAGSCSVSCGSQCTGSCGSACGGSTCGGSCSGGCSGTCAPRCGSACGDHGSCGNMCSGRCGCGCSGGQAGSCLGSSKCCGKIFKISFHYLQLKKKKLLNGEHLDVPLVVMAAKVAVVETAIINVMDVLAIVK